jgi:hypothetical protein
MDPAINRECNRAVMEWYETLPSLPEPLPCTVLPPAVADQTMSEVFDELFATEPVPVANAISATDIRPFDFLDFDLLVNILSFLDRHISVAYFVCREWRRACIEPVMWKTLTCRRNCTLVGTDLVSWSWLPPQSAHWMVEKATFAELVASPPLPDLAYDTFSVQNRRNLGADRLYTLLAETTDLPTLANGLVSSWELYRAMLIADKGDLQEHYTTWLRARQCGPPPPVADVVFTAGGHAGAARFIKGFLYIISLRVCEITTPLHLPVYIRQQVFTLLSHVLRNDVDLLAGRQVDTLIMCAVYILGKANNLVVTFEAIIKGYKTLDGAASGSYRLISARPAGHAADFATGTADLVRFYNTIFLPTTRARIVEMQGETAAQPNMVHDGLTHVGKAARVRLFMINIPVPRHLQCQILSVMRHTIQAHQPALAERHIDQFLLCTFYAVLNLHREVDSPFRSLKGLVARYDMFPGAHPAMYRQVFMGEGTPPVDILTFYLNVYWELMKDALSRSNYTAMPAAVAAVAATAGLEDADVVVD